MSTQTVFVKAGATSQTIDVALVQKAAATSPGDPITGVAYNTSSFTAYYRNGATGTLTAITLATQTVGGAFSSGGFVEVSSTNAPGEYRFDIPDAAIPSAVGTRSYITFNGAANLATHTVCLVGSPAVDTTSIGGTAQTARDIGASVLLSNGTGTGQVKLASGYVAMTWADIASPTTTVNLSGTTISTSQAVASVSGAVGSVTGAVGSVTGNVGGNVTGSVGSISSGGITEASYSTTAGSFYPLGIIDQGTAQAVSATTIQLRSAATFPDSNPVGATVMLTNGTNAGATAIIESYVGSTDTATFTAWSGGITPTGTPTYKVFGSASANYAALVDAIWDEPTSGHSTAGTTGKSLTDASSAGDPWSTALPGSYTSGQAGYIIGNRIDAAVSSRMATYTQPTGFLAATFPTTVASPTNITAGTITTVTNLTNLPSIPANWLTAAGTAADFGAEMATAVWTDTTAGDFTAANSIGKSIMNGVALGTGLTINGYTGNTPQTGDAYARLGAPAGANVSADIAAAKSDTAAIKAKTDSLTFTTAGMVDSAIKRVGNTTLTASGTGGQGYGA